MQAAAHTPGGYGGVPQAVGKDFVAAGPASPKLPARVGHKLRREARRSEIKAGRTAPMTHDEFHRMGEP